MELVCDACRLQNGKTQLYTKMLLLFVALFAVKHGVVATADSLEKVQAGLFNMLLQNVRPSHEP